MSVNLGTIFVGLLCSSVAIAATEARNGSTRATAAITTYSNLRTALTAGENVRLTVSFKDCTSADGSAHGPALTGGMLIQSFVMPSQQYIAFSDVHETLDAQSNRTTEFIRYRAMPDGTVSITATILTAAGEVRSQDQCTCQIGKGISFFRY